jgi:hypothetical protein
MIGTMSSPVGVAGCHGGRLLANHILDDPPFAVEEALNRYYPESELSDTAILESSLVNLLLGPSEWLGCLVVSCDESIDVLLQLLDDGERGPLSDWRCRIENRVST